MGRGKVRECARCKSTVDTTAAGARCVLAVTETIRHEDGDSSTYGYRLDLCAECSALLSDYLNGLKIEGRRA